MPIPVHTHMHNLVPPVYFFSLYELASYTQIPNSGLGHHPDSSISAPSLYLPILSASSIGFCLSYLLSLLFPLLLLCYFPNAGHQSHYSLLTTGASTIRFCVANLFFEFLKHTADQDKPFDSFLSAPAEVKML